MDDYLSRWGLVNYEAADYEFFATSDIKVFL